MKSTLVLSAALLLMTVGVYGAGGDMGAGTNPNTNGSADYPWLIEDLPDFHVFTGNSDYWDDHTRLDCDLDLSAAGTYTQAPIAGDPDTVYDYNGTEFSGTFDGNSHVIRNLTVEGEAYCGLFGKLASGSEIKNLGMENVSISGTGYYVGGLIGWNSGIITSSYSTGEVTGSSSHIGGLVGHHSSGSITGSYSTGSVAGRGSVGGLLGYNALGSINNSYSTGTVSGSGDNVGGLVGNNFSGNITSSYSTGMVTGDDSVGGLIGYNRSGDITNTYSTGGVTGNSFVGGLVGQNTFGDITSSYSTGVVAGNSSIGGLAGSNHSGAITSCYFYIYSGPDNDMGLALDDDQLQDRSSFIGFDFAGDPSDGTEDYWIIEPGYMPRLTWQEEPGFDNPLDTITTTLSGTGYANDPFIIADYADLMEFRNNSALRIGHYSLTNNIDLFGAVYSEAFIAESFNGSFAGNGYVISNLTIDGGGYLGFFSRLYGSVDNLALENISIIGSGDYVGGLAGMSSSSISNCYLTGTVSGGSYVGGLLGDNSGIITSSYSTGEVYGSGDYVGGLVGNNANSISNCYSTGMVSGSSYVGGLVGSNAGDIINNSGSITSCYSTGIVTASVGYAGGLVGGNSGNITSCYSTGAVTGSNYVGGLIGRNTGSITSSYSTGMVTGDDYVGGLTDCDIFGSITNCYFYIYSSPGSSSCGVALDDIQLQETGSFVGFDFVGDPSDGTDDCWIIEPGYMPRLVWQDSPGFEAPYILDTITTTLSGTGYSDDPFIIASYADLIEFRSNLALRIGHYSLTNNIDLAGVTYIDAFIPENFYGSFDGNGYAISNLTIDGGSYLGFFSILYGSVGNLALEDVYIVSSGDYVGGLVGYIDSGSITNCYSAGMVTGSGDFVGGLVGSSPSGDITSCYSIVAVTGSGDYVGGLVGGIVGNDNGGIIFPIFLGSAINSDSITSSYSTGTVTIIPIGGVTNSGSITNCYSTGAVSGGSSVGGLVGSNSSVDITSCYSTSAVTGSGDYVGGLVGGMVGNDSGAVVPIDSVNNSSGDISNCYSTGTVSGSSFVGGLVGSNPSGDITSCYSTAAVTGSGDYVGGLVGRNYGSSGFPLLGGASYSGSITNCYFTGTIAGNAFVGGLAGYNSGSITSCYSNAAITGSGNYVGGLVGWNVSSDGLLLPGDANNSDNITNCYSTGTVSGNAFVGGLAGYSSGSITGCYSSVAVTGSGDYVGGLVGRNYSSISNCYSTGAVSGNSSVGGLVGYSSDSITGSYSNGAVTGSGDYVGGLVGKNYGSSPLLIFADDPGIITNCYSTGTVAGNAFVGGLAGHNTGNITSCYSTAAITGSGDYVGGLVGMNVISSTYPGYIINPGSITNCFWDVQTSEMTDGVGNEDPDPEGATGKTTAEMQKQSTFPDWDFDDVWYILPDDYPRLWLAEPLVSVATPWSLVSKNRVGRSMYEYECEIDVINVSSADLYDVSLALVDGSGQLIINDPNVNFGDILSGQTAASTDTFTITIDRNNPVELDSLYWRVSFAASSTAPLVKQSFMMPATFEIIDFDFNGDGTVDIGDLRFLASKWLQSGSCDVTGPEGQPDGIVNLLDFAAIVNELD